MAPSQQDSAVRQASRSNHVSALAVGIVLLLGAGWYYLSARSASEHLARNSFRQLNNLADQADAVMVNFPHLFNFLPVASTASGAVRRNAPDPQADCTLAALSAEGSGLPRYLECQLLASGERDATRTAAAREALAEEQRRQAPPKPGSVIDIEALRQAVKQLEADKGVLGSVQGAQSAAAQALSSAQGDLADSQNSYQQALAEADQLAAAVKAEIARQAKVSSGSSSASSSSGSYARGAVSSDGFIRPIDAAPGSPFGMRFHPILHVWRLHEGVDFGASCGAPIYAAKSGTVVMSRMTLYSGNYTVIDHGTVSGVDVTTTYSHQSSMAVRVGQHVSRGEVIGYVGDTGLSTVCHLHFEVRHDGSAVNPMDYTP